MTRLIFTLAFVLGAAAVVTMGANFLHSNALALSVTGVIGGVYVIGAVELVQFRRATATLSRSLAGLDAEAAGRLVALDEWLIKLHASLQHPVRRRVEGERIGLPAPVLTPYLVSLLVMLGLLGTFVGLVETLKGVVVALEGSSELESIRQALTAPMSGLGLAFGLGARDTVENLLAAHYLRRQVRPGDTVELGGVRGRVVEVEDTVLVLDSETGRTLVPAATASREIVRIAEDA